MSVSVPTSAHSPEADWNFGALSGILHRPNDPGPQQISTLQVSPKNYFIFLFWTLEAIIVIIDFTILSSLLAKYQKCIIIKGGIEE